MNLKKFIAPIVVILIALSAFWLAGVEPVTKQPNGIRVNIQKYAEVQEKIMDNYVDPVNLNKLYKQSLIGFISRLDTTYASIKNTPLDTAFTNINLNGLVESVSKFTKAYKYMHSHYPKTNMDKNTVMAIRYMFNMLDPHSIYIKPTHSKRIMQRFRGKFQGVGIWFQIRQDTLVVISTVAGGPSAKVGIHAGDRIIAINDSSAVGFSTHDVRNALLGPKGTKVDVTIKRPHVDHLLHFTITRDVIPIYTVSTSYMIDSKTGYIKINRFAATTHKEFMKAVHKLRKKGMQRLMIDLRGNPGGYMRQAILLASEFFPKGTEILSTKSRFLRYTTSYYSPIKGELQHIPLIVLVNKGTASASEIFSGAIQDHDRGLIVGQRTYGKGLVQRQYTLVDSSKIRVTIARYYTPSGRLIQKPYKNGRPVHIIASRSHNAVKDVKNYLSRIQKKSDSLVFHTDAGRVVYGGGGIVPDRIVQEDTSYTNVIINYIRQKRIGLKFARNFLDSHGQAFSNKWRDNYTAYRKHFELGQQAVNKVLKMLKNNNVILTDTLSQKPFMVKVKPKVTSELDQQASKKISEKPNTEVVLADTLSQTSFQAKVGQKTAYLYITPTLYKKARGKITGLMEANIARDIWGQKKYYPIINAEVYDKVINKAMTYWNVARRFAKGNISVNKDGKLYIVEQN